jgi:hypothetical protein
MGVLVEREKAMKYLLRINLILLSVVMLCTGAVAQDITKGLVVSEALSDNPTRFSASAWDDVSVSDPYESAFPITFQSYFSDNHDNYMLLAGLDFSYTVGGSVGRLNDFSNFRIIEDINWQEINLKQDFDIDQQPTEELLLKNHIEADETDLFIVDNVRLDSHIVPPPPTDILLSADSAFFMGQRY